MTAMTRSDKCGSIRVRLNPGGWWRTSRVLFLYKWLSNVVKYLQLIVFAVCFTAKNQYRTSFHFIQASKDGSDHNCWLTLNTIQFNVCCPHTSYALKHTQEDPSTRSPVRPTRCNQFTAPVVFKTSGFRDWLNRSSQYQSKLDACISNEISKIESYLSHTQLVNSLRVLNL